MRWVFDIDGTIDSNPSFFAWFTYHLKKPANNHTIIIITCRNPERQGSTLAELQSWGIVYDQIYFMPPDHDRSHRSLLEWKLAKIIAIDPDIWFDDCIKLYNQLYKIDLANFVHCKLVQM